MPRCSGCRPTTSICTSRIPTTGTRPLDAYDRLIKAGKVRAIGASNYSAARLAEALETSRRLGLPRYESLQPHYNLYTRAEYESELEPLVLREGLGVFNYYALASGFLSGKYRSEADLDKSGARGQRSRPTSMPAACVSWRRWTR